MELYGYFDLGKKELLDSPDGGGIKLPSVVAGEHIRIGMRFVETREGETVELYPTINAVRASLGSQDLRPLEGTWAITVNGDTTESLDFDATAEQLQAAIADLSEFSGVGDVEVIARQDSFIVTFPNDPETTQTIVAALNRLHPISHVRVRVTTRGGVKEHEIRLVQAPVAYSADYELQNPPIPTITELRAGGGDNDILWAEVQKLYVPPTFKGTFRIVRGGVRTEPIYLADGAEEIQEKLEPLVDVGGLFRVERTYDGVAYIYFEGDMIGIDQALMTIEVFDGPPPDTVVTLYTNTREMADSMQGVDSTTMILQVSVQLEDADDPGVYHWHTILREVVDVVESNCWDELDTAPPIDWLKPPTFVTYHPFSPDQVTTGNQHYYVLITDDTEMVHSITHGLNTTEIFLTLIENSNPGIALIPGVDYTWVRDNANQVTVTFDSAPVSPGVAVMVMGLTETSQFNAHGHVFGDVTGMVDWMSSIESRLSAIETVAGSPVVSVSEVTGSGEVARWILPQIWELYPSRQQPERSESGRIADIDLSAVDSNGKLVIGRGRGLLPAIYDGSVSSIADSDALASTVATIKAAISAGTGATYKNQVYQYNGTPSLLTVGLGNRATTVEAGDYIGCDGRVVYPVVRYGPANVEVTVKTNEAAPGYEFTYTSDHPTIEQFVPGLPIRFSSGQPTGFSTNVTYYAIAQNYTDRTFKLATSENGSAVQYSATSSSAVLKEYTAALEFNFYPKHFERTLFTIHVNEKQLRYRKDLELGFSFETAVFSSASHAQWTLRLELGHYLEDVDTAVGRNLKKVVWRSIPALEQTIRMSSVAATHSFGCKISRRLIESVDTLTMQNIRYGAIGESPVPPSSANFAIRAKLGRFDTEDHILDPRGLVMLSGLKVEPFDSSSAEPEIELGYGVIS